MSPQKNLSNFIDALLLAYILSNNITSQDVRQSVIDDYKRLNDKCDSVITKIRARKLKTAVS